MGLSSDQYCEFKYIIGWELGIVHTLTKGVLWTDESGFYIGAEVERTCLKNIEEVCLLNGSDKWIKKN